MRYFVVDDVVVGTLPNDCREEGRLDALELVLPETFHTEIVTEDLRENTAPPGQEEFYDSLPPVETFVEERLVVDPATKFAAAKKAQELHIERLHSNTLAVITGGYSTEERDTWPRLLEWAHGVVNDSDPAAIEALAGMVPDIEAAAVGLNPDTPEARAEYFANKVIGKAAIYDAAIISAGNSKREAYVALEGCQTLDELIAFRGVLDTQAADRLREFEEQMQ